MYDVLLVTIYLFMLIPGLTLYYFIPDDGFIKENDIKLLEIADKFIISSNLLLILLLFIFLFKY